MSEYMSLKEAGRVLGYSRRSVAELVRGGEIPGYSRNTQVKRGDIDEARRRWGDDGGQKITVEQAADVLNKSVITIKRYCRTGRLTPIQRSPRCYVWLSLREVLALRRQLYGTPNTF